jgi:hypothetical protein
LGDFNKDTILCGINKINKIFFSFNRYL